MAYSDNPLLQEIRKERGFSGTASEGVAEPPTALQDELRPLESEDRKPGGNSKNGGGGSGRGNGTGESAHGTIKRSHHGKGRTNTALDEDNSRVDGRNRSNNSAISTTAIAQRIAAVYQSNPGITYAQAGREAGCSTSTATKYLRQLRGEIDDDEEQSDASEPTDNKPTGLKAQPHEKEERIRREQAEEQARIEQATKATGNIKGIYSFFARGKGEQRGTGSTQKEGIRNKPFSEREAEEIKPALMAALLDYFKYLDELVYATHRKHVHVQIWSTIDEEEAEVLVDAWLGRAKRSARAASHVVHTVNMHAQLRVGIILLPRFYETFKVYMDAGFGVK